MAGTSTQPDNVSTADTPPERPANVVTDETKNAGAGDASQAAPEGKDKPEGQTTGDDATPGNDKAKPRRDRSAERKIARLTKKLATEQSARQQDRQRMDELERQIEELRQGKPAAKPKKPDIKDFDTPELYAKAYAKWEKAQGEEPGKKRDEPGKRSDPAKPPADAAQGPTAEELKAFKQAGQEKLGDEFLEAYQNPDDFAVSQPMGDYVLDSEVGPELYVWLYNHPEEALKLYRKSETAVVRRLDELSKRIRDEGTWDVDDKPAGKKGGDKDGKGGKRAEGGDGKGSGDRTTSRAPEPPSEPDRGEANPEPDLEKLSMDDYAATRRKQIKKSGVPIL